MKFKLNPAIKVVGIGTTAVSIVSEMRNLNELGIETIGIDTSFLDMKECKATRLQIGRDTCQGQPAGDIIKGRKAAEESERDIKLHLSGSDLNFLISCLCGGTSIGATPKVCEISKDLGAVTVCLLILPFRFVGQQKFIASEDVSKEINKRADSTILLHADKLVGDRNLSIGKVMEHIFEFVSDSIANLFYPLSNRSVDRMALINFFRKLNEAYISVGSGSGKLWIRNALDLILRSDLIADVNPEDAGRVYLSIGCNPDALPISAFETISEHFTRYFKNSTTFLYGWYRSSDVKFTLVLGDFKEPKERQKKVSGLFSIDDFVAIPSYKQYKPRKLK